MKRSGLVLATLILAGNTFAGDIAKDIRSGNGGGQDDGGYFEIGLGIDYLDSPNVDDDDDGLQLGLSLGGGYRYKSFFIEASQGTSDGLNIGYNTWSNDQWSLDILASSISGTLTREDDEVDIKDLPEPERDKALVDRDTLYSGAGIRITGYFGDYIFQYRLVTDTHGGNGVVSTARLGRSWQVKNWNFHSIGSLQYNSASTNGYFFGITPAESTARFPAYDPGSTVSFIGEVGVTYPLSENWVYRSFFRYTSLPDTIANSPLMTSDEHVFLGTSLNYVF